MFAWAMQRTHLVNNNECILNDVQCVYIFHRCRRVYAEQRWMSTRVRQYYRIILVQLPFRIRTFTRWKTMWRLVLTCRAYTSGCVWVVYIYIYIYIHTQWGENSLTVFVELCHVIYSKRVRVVSVSYMALYEPLCFLVQYLQCSISCVIRHSSQLFVCSSSSVCLFLHTSFSFSLSVSSDKTAAAQYNSLHVIAILILTPALTRSIYALWTFVISLWCIWYSIFT